MDNEQEGKNYHLQRFLNDTCTSLKKSGSKKDKSRRNKKKQIKLPILDNNRGLFENVLVGKTFCRASYSPLQKARMNEDIFSLAKNRSDEVQIHENDTGLQDTVPLVEQVEPLFNKEGSVKSNCTPKILEENTFKTPERNKSPSIKFFLENDLKTPELDKSGTPQFFKDNFNEPKSDNIHDFFMNLDSEPSSSKRQKLDISKPKPTNNFRMYRTKSTSSESDYEPFMKKTNIYKDHPNHRIRNYSPEKISKLSFFQKNFESKNTQLKSRKRKNRLSPHTY